VPTNDGPVRIIEHSTEKPRNILKQSSAGSQKISGTDSSHDVSMDDKVRDEIVKNKLRKAKLVCSFGREALRITQEHAPVYEGTLAEETITRV